MENAEIGSGRRDALIASLNQELGSTSNPSANVSQTPRLRVPEQIKQSNPEAYTPRFISIGPVHHGKPELQQMEDFKSTYANHLMQRFPIDSKALSDVAKHHEKFLRKDYGITSQEIPSDKFVKIMIIDAAFLLEFLWREEQPGPFNNENRDGVIYDLFLLENQIPLDYLSQIFHPNIEMERVLNLWDKFLEISGPFSTATCNPWSFRKEYHLLDRLRTRMAYATNEGPPVTPCDFRPTISQLHRAGVDFRCTHKCSPELTFRRGTLKIPPLTIDRNTRRYFANLLASELSANDHYATDYIALMYKFIDGPEDVRMLVERGILKNHLEENKPVESFINEIGRSVNTSHDSRYMLLVKNLNDHCNPPRSKWWKKVFH